jgi:hypothetical protein
MPQVLIDAYDPRHPENEALMNLEADSGLDIALHPRFEIMITITDGVTKSTPSRGPL